MPSCLSNTSPLHFIRHLKSMQDCFWFLVFEKYWKLLPGKLRGKAHFSHITSIFCTDFPQSSTFLNSLLMLQSSSSSNLPLQSWASQHNLPHLPLFRHLAHTSPSYWGNVWSPPSSITSVIFFWSASSLHGSLVDVKASSRMPGRKERLQPQPLMPQSPRRPLSLRRRMGEPCWTSSSCSREPKHHHCPEHSRCLRWVPNCFLWPQGIHYTFHGGSVRNNTWVYQRQLRLGLTTANWVNCLHHLPTVMLHSCPGMLALVMSPTSAL